MKKCRNLIKIAGRILLKAELNLFGGNVWAAGSGQYSQHFILFVNYGWAQ